MRTHLCGRGQRGGAGGGSTTLFSDGTTEGGSASLLVLIKPGLQMWPLELVGQVGTCLAEVERPPVNPPLP